LPICLSESLVVVFKMIVVLVILLYFTMRAK
jgi:hypothetical protein